MIYASTRRPFWSPALTSAKFLLTCVVLGAPVALLLRMAPAAWSRDPEDILALARSCVMLCVCLIAVSGAKLLTEATVFCWLRARTFTPLRRTALLMTGELGRVTLARFAVGLLGGLALPGLLLASAANLDALRPNPLAMLVLAGAILVLCIVGEVLERYLFFAAVVAPKMPGAPAT
jgi:DMSO reductase anchor subunit